MSFRIKDGHSEIIDRFNRRVHQVTGQKVSNQEDWQVRYKKTASWCVLNASKKFFRYITKVYMSPLPRPQLAQHFG